MDKIGKTLTFHEAVQSHSIEIPILQRDYAQGRIGATEILEHFLKTIKRSLENNSPLSLDFIYGSIENSKFIPLDGQQRLTTLFLLHWYLAKLDDNEEHLKEYLLDTDGDSQLAKFTYETRFSSRDFCKMLLTKELTFEPEDNPSNIIKDQAWFYLNWQQDPTIKAMLNSLDTIHKLFQNTEGLYDKLSDSETKPVYFEFIELENFGLTDQLYIKMNSRGKPLTPFENFKANLEQVLQDYDKDNGTEHNDWFAQRIDKEWTDLFWIYRDNKTNLVDGRIMNFLRAMFTNSLVLKPALKEDVDSHSIRKLINSGDSFNFFLLEELNCADFDTIFSSLHKLDLLTDDGSKLKLYLDDALLIDEEKLFLDLITDDLTYTQRIQASALYQFVLEYGTEGLHDWIRVVRNLTEGSPIEDYEDYIGAIQTVDKLMKHSRNILEYLGGLGSERLKDLADYQTKEEIIKAQLILRNTGWRERVESIENHPYFSGQIDFILDFSGISESANTDGINSWSEEQEEAFQQYFDLYSQKADTIFKEDGIKEFEDYRFERALLSFGDYLLKKKGNWSFLIDGTDREISWKRLLRHTNRKFLKELVDSLTIESIEDQLQRIIEDNAADDWRKYFIQLPETIRVCGTNKYTRWLEDDGSSIFLLEKSQTNGLHREYYSYALACLLRKEGHDVVYHPDSSIDYLKYISEINGVELAVTYGWNGSEYSYMVALEDEEVQNFNDQDTIIEFLDSKGILKK